jgi:DNA-directed RNA polymerase alpha subunit/DNA-directed RNA polymerase subunit L
VSYIITTTRMINTALQLSKKELPHISSLIDDETIGLHFTLSNVDMCFANAIRRTILSDIDIVCILSDKYERNQVTININSGRLHNEILKHRLSCIPIHFNGNKEEMEIFCRDYKLYVDCKNETNEMQIVTTEDFHVVNKVTGVEIETARIFRPGKTTNRFIDFSRLRPKISETIAGEALKLSANFSISNAKDNAMYNVVSKCSYSNTIDPDIVLKKWKEFESEYRSKNLTIEEIQFEKKNFYLLDGQRCFVENSFDFIIQGLDIFSNIALLKMSCDTLITKFDKLIKDINVNDVPILRSETTMQNSFDMILVREDYTIGKILEYILYTKFYTSKTPTLNFCGFKKFHPHDAKSTIRIAFVEQHKDKDPKQLLHYASQYAILILQYIASMLPN